MLVSKRLRKGIATGERSASDYLGRPHDHLAFFQAQHLVPYARCKQGFASGRDIPAVDIEMYLITMAKDPFEYWVRTQSSVMHRITTRRQGNAKLRLHPM